MITHNRPKVNHLLLFIHISVLSELKFAISIIQMYENLFSTSYFSLNNKAFQMDEIFYKSFFRLLREKQPDYLIFNCHPLIKNCLEQY
ncbi:MAG: hypothetical protein D6799_06495 [Bacteroidetes bacterium]|nr:MAG: hypothetical protein D6799_06495 [Bacteroidota bacterium]